MSLSGAKRVLAATIAFAVGSVVFVHYSQKAERDRMHQGVVREIERERRAVELAAAGKPEEVCEVCELAQKRVVSEEEAAARAQRDARQ